MRKILILSAYINPFPNSAAKMMSILVDALLADGFDVTLISTSGKYTPSEVDCRGALTSLTFKNPFMRSRFLVLRFIFELITPVLSAIYFRRVLCSKGKFDITLWYSPTIFWSLLIRLLSLHMDLGVKVLIIRDIFPKWAVDTGTLTNRYVIKLLNFFHEFQLRLANHIWAQSESDCEYLIGQAGSKPVTTVCNWDKITNTSTKLSVIPSICYFGNLGQAQNYQEIVPFVCRLANLRPKVSWNFYGLHELEAKQFQLEIKRQDVTNIYLNEEVTAGQMSDILSKTSVSLFCLSFDLSTHNVPGKFVASAMQGVPAIGIFRNNDALNALYSSLGYNGCVSEINTDLFFERFDELSNISVDQRSEISEMAAQLFNVRNVVKKLSDLV